MQIYIDKEENIFTEPDYAPDANALNEENWYHSKEEFSVDHEDFIVTVPAATSLEELDSSLKDFKLFSNIAAPQNYSLSRILAEYQDSELFDKVLGLDLLHSDKTETKTGAKVIKNVSGYDMKKLYIGSFNSLALIANAFLRVEKLFDEELLIEFKLKNDLEEVFLLRNFLQTFLDKNIGFKLSYNKLFDDFSVSIKTSASAKILDYRQRAIEKFIKSELDTKSLAKSKRQAFNIDYKKEKRIELKFNFSDLAFLLEELSKAEVDLVIEPLKNLISLSTEAQELRTIKIDKILSLSYDFKLFPVNLENRLFLKSQAGSAFEEELLFKIKKLYDDKALLNPGIL